MQIKDLLIKASEQGASDIHLTVGVPPIFRINGVLTKIPGDLLKPQDLQQMAQSWVLLNIPNSSKVGRWIFPIACQELAASG